MDPRLLLIWHEMGKSDKYHILHFNSELQDHEPWLTLGSGLGIFGDVEVDLYYQGPVC